MDWSNFMVWLWLLCFILWSITFMFRDGWQLKNNAIVRFILWICSGFLFLAEGTHCFGIDEATGKGIIMGTFFVVFLLCIHNMHRMMRKR